MTRTLGGLLRQVVAGAALLVLSVSTGVSAQQRGRVPSSGKPTYAQLVNAGHEYFKEGKTKEAYVAALMAAEIDPDRSESYALSAAVMYAQGSPSYAKQFIDRALARATAAQKPQLRQLAALIDKSLASQKAGAPPAANTSRPSATPAPGGPPSTVPALAGSRWSGALKGSYAYERSASKPLDATFTAALQPAGKGAALYNALRQTVTWNQNGRYIYLESSLREYGCPAKLIIRATVDGARMNGVFNIAGDGCAPATGTWTARLAK